MIIYISLSVDPHQSKLTPEEREQNLSPLLSTGWTVQANRDAIYKEFVFKNFNEVCRIQILLFTIIIMGVSR